ncbi:hypothetical protein [Sulfurospirillum barnesii]|uniref:Uncharacterized protein n=1 Tax=Sulfurospirillum barnesii (strain ATCC 700032 / DSM 10660 / SES-3) TaxID=760154 RepID=I3Y085_SULBS|nr:hypothetical protein [Sulfurospirillum barnesii]AFL69609.1 hypothetical protein Sulba_2339 [Sulfurospirillum barnesii SES-3]
MLLLEILEILLDYLNKNEKIEASALNEMLEKYKKAVEKEEEDEIKNRYSEILENFNKLIMNQNENEVIENLKNLLKEVIILEYSRMYNETEHGTIEDLSQALPKIQTLK